MSDVEHNLAEIRQRMEDASARSGRGKDAVELAAVSKTFSSETIREAVEAGQTLFAESRVQELAAKAPELPSSLRWHFIGRLQKNKIRKMVGLVEAVHSVDSLELAEDLNRIAGEEGRRLDVYVQVNVAEDAAKQGFTPESARRHLEALLALPRLSVLGLMTIPPLVDDPEKNRPAFAALRGLRDALAAESGVPLPGLSMGMSEDFEIAIEEGATIVRVGSALFGKRRSLIRAAAEM